MPEPTAPERLRTVKDVVQHLENGDPNIQAIRALREQCTDRFQQNCEAIMTGDWSAPVPYDLPEFAAFHPTTYPVDITRGGEFVSRHLAQFAHLPTRHDVPGIVKLTLGDLDATAEWEMLPTLNPDCRRRPQANRLKQLVEDVTYRAIQRRLYLIRQLLAQQIWDAVNAQRQQELLNYQQMQATTQLNSTQVETALASSTGIVAERTVFTMAARLGSRITPPFRTFRARAGEDRYEHVDILMRVEPPESDPTLVGIDVTALDSAQDIWRKHYTQQQSGKVAQRGTMRDPARPEQYLPVHRSVLSAAYASDWDHLVPYWSQQRGVSILTPEYVLLKERRVQLGRKILKAVKHPDGTPYYDKAKIDHTYQALYGEYDQSVGY